MWLLQHQSEGTPPFTRQCSGVSSQLVEPWWNPGGTLVEPFGTLWNLTSDPPRTTPELSGLRHQSFQLLGKKTGERRAPIAGGPSPRRVSFPLGSVEVSIWVNYNILPINLRWLGGYSPQKPPFGVRSCEVLMISHLLKTGIGGGRRPLECYLW